MKLKNFRAILEPVSPGGCFVVVPPEVAEAAGLKFKDRVRGTIDGAQYRSSLMKYGGVFHMGVHRATLANAGVSHGDEVNVGIERDTAPLPNDRIPADLARALAARKGAAAAFAALAPSRRREHVGSIVEAKKPETRTRRIAKVLATLNPEKNRRAARS
jgi:hypothetical protein